MSNGVKKIEDDSKKKKTFNGFYLGKFYYLKVGPDKTVLPSNFEEFYDRITNFEVRDDDVFTLAFPKTGSRWMQEMVWLLVNNLNFKKAMEVPLEQRSRVLELQMFFNKEEYGFDKLEESESPRCIKSHLPWSLLPKSIRNGVKKPKIIVTLRGPEDTCTSYYHFARVLANYQESWEDFCEMFLDDKVPFSPFWKHLLGLWEQRHRPNIIFIKFNQMKSDLTGTIRDLAAFLGKNLSNEDISKLCKHLSFDNLKTSKGYNMEHLKDVQETGINPFVRKGNVGDHRNCMSPKVIEAFKKQRKQFLYGTGITFD
ncbi:hypothetical protein FQR65_LT02064 [Abscondita terminalis]|nr:hypothetical protein FQR65_LT02064 [Abscondita terminalis]